MNAERLLALYDRVADAPDAVSRLRRFVLDLAVQGKLAEQDPVDEPASELLKRIKAEKAKLVKLGNIKPRKLKFRPRQHAVEFKKPSGWQLTDLGSVAIKITDGAHKTPTYVSAGVPFVSVKDFSAGRLNLGNTRFIPLEEHEVLYERCDPRRGDILLGRIGTLGKAVIVDTDVEFSLFVSVGLIRFDHAYIHPVFLRIVLNSPFVEAEFDRIKIGGGTHTNKLNLGDLHTVALPLPPLAEQHRIVAKVDELMTLCDRQEEARITHEETRDRLTNSSYARLSAPDTDDGAFRAKARFAINALPQLTARADQVQSLRQTILNLAVRGKLVKQDPTDEPASELLTRIAAEKARLVKAGKIRKPTASHSIDGEELPFEAPRHWAWLRLRDIGTLAGGMTPSKSRAEYWSGDVIWLSPKDIKVDEVSDCELKITEKGLSDTRLKLFPAGSLFMVARSGILKRTFPVAINRVPAASNQDLKILVPFLKGQEQYLQIMFRGLTDFILKELVKTGTTVQSLRYAEFEAQPFPIPPLAEQHRIVAKIAELMVLCDRLETNLGAVDTGSHLLLVALLRDALENVGYI